MSKIVFNPNSIFNSSQANFVVNKDAIYAFTRSISGLNTAVYGIQPTPQQCIDGVKIEDISANHSLCSDVYRLNDNVDAMKFFAQRPFVPCSSEAERDEIATNPLAVYLTPISASESSVISSNDNFEWIFVFNQDLGWDYIKEYTDGKHYLSAAELSGLGEWELIGSTSMTDDKISALIKYVDDNFLDRRTGGTVSGDVVVKTGNSTDVSITQDGVAINNGSLTIKDVGGTNFLSSYRYGNIAFGYAATANADGAVALGYGADALAPNSIAINGDVYRSDATRAIAIGASVAGADAIGIGRVDNSAPSAVAIGTYAVADVNGVGIGTVANAGENGVAIGRNATALGSSIQLGEGVNEELSSLKVYNYQIIDSNGDIPSDRLTAAINPIKEEILDELDAETERAISAENALRTEISSEATARQTADDAIRQTIQDVSVVLSGIDQTLSSEIVSTVSTLNQLSTNIISGLSNEINPRISVIADLVSAEVERFDAFSVAVELSVANLCNEIGTITSTLSDAVQKSDLRNAISSNISAFEDYALGRVALENISSIIEWNTALHFALSAVCNL